MVPPSPSRLLERDAEITLLARLVDAAGAGRPHLIAIEGPGGIGKTRLLSAARGRAVSAGVQVLDARGSEREQRLPFGVVDQLFPGVRNARTATAEAGDADESFAILAALFEEAQAIAERSPVMLVIDDLHLCDEPSLQFLGFLTRRLGRLRASILATLRPFERSDSAALLSELLGDPLTTSIRPSALSQNATAELLSTALGREADASFAAACREATGGNPLLLSELVKSLHHEHVAPVASQGDAVRELGPRAVLRTVLVRMAGLPAGAALARAIAVLGESADLPLAGALAGLDPEATRTAAAALIRAEILADQPGAAFVHPLVESAVYEDIPAPERSRAHEAAANLLRERGQDASVIAAHLILAPPAGHAWVCDTLTEAARASLRAGAPGDAVAALQRALAEPPAAERRPDLVAALARATMLVDGPGAVPRLRDALELTEDPVARAALAIDLARILMFIDRVDESAPLLQRAWADLPPESGDMQRMLATTTLMLPLFDPGHVPPPAVVELGRRLPLPAGIGAKMLASQSARNWAYDGGPADACAELAMAALEGGDLIRADSVFLSVSAVLVLELADRPEADAGWAALRRECDLHGSHQARLAVNLFHGYGLARRGELAAAEASLDEALEAKRDWNGIQGVHTAAFRARVRIERGDLPGARAELETVPPPSRPSDEARVWLDSQALLLNAESRHEEALSVADELQRRFDFLPHALDTPALEHRAVALDGLGRHDEALAAAEDALAQARTWGSPGVVGRALRVLGTIQGDAAGIDRLREAVDITLETPAALEHAKAQVELGVLLRAADGAVDARGPLRVGLELATQMDADELAARARRELYAAGGRPRTTALSGPKSLTDAERRVVELAAGGDTNRQIAETLFVTPKTVELHLGNAYRKLGVGGRRELAAAMGDAADP